MTHQLDAEGRKLANKLLTRHRRFLRSEPRETRELFAQVVAAGRKGQFFKLITDIKQKNNFGRSIALQNKTTCEELHRRGINTEKWVTYQGIEKQAFKDPNAFAEKQLWADLMFAMIRIEMFSEKTAFYESVKKDSALLKQAKKAILAGEIKVPDNDPISLHDSPIFRTCAKTDLHLRRKGTSLLTPAEYSGVDWDAVHNSLREIVTLSKSTEYSVGVWARDPARDIFLGNLSKCCIAIGEYGHYPAPNLRLNDVDYNKFPAGILEFLIDAGIQVAEIAADGKTFGCCWLFLSENDNGKADLVADSIDFDAALAESRPAQKAVRDCTLRFLKNYAETIGAERVLIGKVGPMMSSSWRRPIMIDFRTDGLPVVKLQRPINKIGGYFRGRPYFLESRHGNEAYLVR